MSRRKKENKRKVRKTKDKRENLELAAILRAQSPGSTCRRGLNVAVESDDEAQEANEVVEWDDEAQDEADEAVESNLV